MMTREIKTFILRLGAALLRDRGSKFLYYHDIYAEKSYTSMGTPLSLFKEHVQVISEEGFNLVPNIVNPEREVQILMDDGFRGVYDVRDYFFEQRIYPTIFLAVSLIGKEGYLDKAQIRFLQEQGFNFQCHAWSHDNLTLFSDEALKRELGESKTYLEDLLGKPVDEICLPIGFFSDHLLSEIEKYNYKVVYSSVPGNATQRVRGRMLPRNLVQFSSPQEVRYILHGGGRILKSHYERMHFVR